MPRINSRRSPRRRRSQAAKLDFAAPIVMPEEKPVRGVKLKTVSAFTMLFALLCLFAFMAGRVDVAATNQPPKTAKASTSISKAGYKRAVAGRAKKRDSSTTHPGTQIAEGAICGKAEATGMLRSE